MFVYNCIQIDCLYQFFKEIQLILVIFVLPDCMHYFIAFLAGLACKLYDDLSDNPLLEHFKTPVLMEFLKGVQYILLTAVSLHNPVFFMLFYLICTVNSVADPKAWSGPYESGFLYASALIYVLVQYEQLPQLNVSDVCFMIIILPSIACEPLIIPQHIEFSLWKFIARSFFVCALLCIIVLPIFTVTIKYLLTYCIGYFLCSVFVQYYSLYKTAKKRKRPRTLTECMNRIYKMLQKKLIAGSQQIRFTVPI